MKGLIPRDLEEAFLLAERLASSAIMPVHLEGRPADVYATILAGMELGLPVMGAIRSFYLSDDGELRLLADTMAAIVLASPLCEHFQPLESTELRATWEAKRRGHPRPIKFTWSIEQQRQIGWAPGSMWDTDPLSMLSARAKSRLLRNVFPDLLAGIHAVEEMGHSAERAEPPRREQATGAVLAAESAALAAAALAAAEPDDDHEMISTIRAALLDASSEAAVKRIMVSLAKKSAAVRAEVTGDVRTRLEQVRRSANLEIEQAPTDGGGS